MIWIEVTIFKDYNVVLIIDIRYFIYLMYNISFKLSKIFIYGILIDTKIYIT